MILEPAVNLCSRPNVTVSITCPAGPLRDTVEADISFYTEMVQDSLKLFHFSSSLLIAEFLLEERKIVHYQWSGDCKQILFMIIWTNNNLN